MTSAHTFFFRLCFLLICASFLGACSQLTVTRVEPAPDTVREPVEPPPVISAPVQKVVSRIVAEPVAPVVAEPLSVAVLYRAASDSDGEIVDALMASLGRPYEILALEGMAEQDLLAYLRASNHSQLIAIGERAAVLASDLDLPIVFAQVFNYRQRELLARGLSGVNMIPSPEKLFMQWQKLAEDLNRIAIITGSMTADQITQISDAASDFGIAVEHYQVASDKEWLYTAKNVSANVQGFWLLPDHRVLSRRVLKEFMAHSTKHGKQVAVFNEYLLEFGGLLYVGINPEDVSARIIEQLDNLSSDASDNRASILVLQQADIEINQHAAEQLQLQ